MVSVSFIIRDGDTTPVEGFSNVEGELGLNSDNLNGGNNVAAAVILSREGPDGSHLRSTTSLILETGLSVIEPYNAASKEAAIRSYMASGSTSDWPQVPDENA